MNVEPFRAPLLPAIDSPRSAFERSPSSPYRRRRPMTAVETAPECETAALRLAEMTPPGHRPVIHVSLTDDHPWAQAFVVIEALPDPAADPAAPPQR